MGSACGGESSAATETHDLSDACGSRVEIRLLPADADGSSRPPPAPPLISCHQAMPPTVWTVSDSETGQRLDKFLADASRLGARARAVAAIGRGKVFLNDVEAIRADAAKRVQP